MNLQQLQGMFEAIQQLHRGHEHRSVSPYAILIAKFLEDSPPEFCLQIIDMATKQLGDKLGDIQGQAEAQDQKLSIIFDEMTRRLSYPDYPAETVLRVFDEKLSKDCQEVAEEAVREFLAQRGQDLNQLMNEGE